MQRLPTLLALPARTILVLVLGAAIGGLASGLFAQGKQVERERPSQPVTLVDLHTRTLTNGATETVQRLTDPWHRTTCYVVVTERRGGQNNPSNQQASIWCTK